MTDTIDQETYADAVERACKALDRELRAANHRLQRVQYETLTPESLGEFQRDMDAFVGDALDMLRTQRRSANDFRESLATPPGMSLDEVRERLEIQRSMLATAHTAESTGSFVGGLMCGVFVGVVLGILCGLLAGR